jgi:DNA-binding CsgD family transcriptional regulator
VFGAADRYRGAMDSLLGLPTAEDRFADALAMDERMGSPLYRAHSLAALVRHRRGTGAGVAELVAEARGIAEPLGLRRVLALLDPEPVLRPNGAAGLTARETEVLRLLAEGMANREIAERLVISENTAANHVRSILAKTGSGNRTQAAMFAAAHRLLG